MVENTSRTQAFSLPSSVRSLDGVVVEVGEDVWSYRDTSASVRLDFTKFEASDILIHSIKRVMLWYVENRACGTVRTAGSRLRGLLSSEAKRNNEPVAEISAASILRYRADLGPSKEHRLGGISGFLKRLNTFGLPGVTEGAVSILREIRLQNANPSDAILTMNPETGPLTAIESECVNVALGQALAQAAITLEEFVLALLFPLLGQRPVQYAALKVRDLKRVTYSDDKSAEYFLEIPRVKQRASPIRSSYTTRRIDPDFGRMLVKHAEDVERRFAQILDDPSQAPLFPAKRRRGSDCSPELAYHRTGNSVGLECRRIYRTLHVISDRTGEPLRLCAVRFRRTVGTRAAEAGHGELEIAYMLDHTDTQCVSTYVRATPAIRDRIDRAIAMRLAPIIEAFQGSVVPPEAAGAKLPADAPHIADPKFDPSMRPMGSCAHHGPCQLLAPIACYTCPNFRPWSDGPHARVLDYLISERDRLYSQRRSRMASTFDLPILAAARVVQICQSSNSHGQETSHD